MELGDILAGRAVWRREPQHQPVIDSLVGGRID
jgi:hypothetical protein